MNGSEEKSFSMPAEWHRHQATWVAWPHNIETWPKRLAEAQDEFVELAKWVARGETVCVVAAGHALVDARSHLRDVANIEFFEIPTNDAWIRDYGPTFVERGGELRAINWRYNCWGQKYPPFDHDVLVAKRIANAQGIETLDSELVVEGGALEVNDAGLMLTTESCLLHPNRNSTRDKSALDELLGTYCGATEVVWLPGAELVGDDTDGHIDQQVRFLQNDVLVVAQASEDDEQFESLQKNIAVLERYRRECEPGWEILELPLPAPVFVDGQRVPASYLNFYFCNEALIVPQFGDARADRHAVELLADSAAKIDRAVIGLPSRYLATGLGSFHCLTQQQPAF